MKRQVAWQRISLAGLLTLAAGVAQASFQGRARVYWLGTEDWQWQLCEKAGGAYLVKATGPASQRLAGDNERRWYVSTPTIRAASGKFLATDPAGRDPALCLVRDKGDNTRWTFEIVSRLAPRRAAYESEGHSFMEGPSGFTFRVKVAEGPFRDWYLAAEEALSEPGKRDGEGAVRPLKLVRDAKQATVFKYVEESYYIDSK